jgi:hypothetical protein
MLRFAEVEKEEIEEQQVKEVYKKHGV